MLRPHQKPHPGQPLALPLQKPPARDACRASPRPTDVLMPTRVFVPRIGTFWTAGTAGHPGGSTKPLLARRRTAPSGDIPLKTNKFEARIGRFFWIPRVDPVFTPTKSQVASSRRGALLGGSRKTFRLEPRTFEGPPEIRPYRQTRAVRRARKACASQLL